MADSHSNPRDETAPFGRPERGTAEADGASPRRHREGRAERPVGHRAEGGGDRNSSEHAYYAPRSAGDHVHVMAPNPFRRWSMNRSLRLLSVLMTSALVMAACSNGSGSPAATHASGANGPAGARGRDPAGG